MELTRQEFEEATQDLLDRTRFTTVQSIKAAGLDPDAASPIRMPAGAAEATDSVALEEIHFLRFVVCEQVVE